MAVNETFERLAALVFCWPRLGVFSCGMVAALGLAPLHLWPFWFVVLPVFFLILEGHFARQSTELFKLGWSFGFGYFLVAFHWIGFAFLVDAKTTLWMMPFAIGGLAGAMAIYWGLAAVLAQLLQRCGITFIIGFPISLALMEYLRGHLFTGFPWAAPGTIADGMGGVLLLAQFIGMPGLTLLILLWAAAPRVLFYASATFKIKMLAVLLLLALPAAYGFGQWQLATTPQIFVTDVGLRIVQPNISQSDKWREENSRLIFDQLLAASAAADPLGHKTTHIIWPESAVSFLIDESEVAKQELGQILRGQTVLITGAIRRDKAPENSGLEDKVYTSVIVFDGQARVVGQYDKWRLVPGGEFLPFEPLLSRFGFRKLVELPGSFNAGAGPQTLAVPGASLVGPLICYEIIFPHRLVDPQNRPNWLVNVTNDGWFGRSAGPYQHFAAVRMRAVEQGLPVVRSANTGISGVVDGLGRVVSASTLGEMAILNAQLPRPQPMTVYARYGDFALFLLMGITLVVGLVGGAIRN